MCPEAPMLVMGMAPAIAVPCPCVLLIESLWFRSAQKCTSSGRQFASLGSSM